MESTRTPSPPTSTYTVIPQSSLHTDMIAEGQRPLHQGSTRTRAGSAYGSRLRALSFCRGIACFLGYPMSLDKGFSNELHLARFIDIILVAASDRKLWDFTTLELCVLLNPLFEYAEYAVNLQKLTPQERESSDWNSITLHALNYQAVNFTVGDALSISDEVDRLASFTNGLQAYTRFYQFIEWCHHIELRDLAWIPSPGNGSSEKRLKIARGVSKLPVNQEFLNLNWIAFCTQLGRYIPHVMSWTIEIALINNTLKSRIVKDAQRRAREETAAVVAALAAPKLNPNAAEWTPTPSISDSSALVASPKSESALTSGNENVLFVHTNRPSKAIPILPAADERSPVAQHASLSKIESEAAMLTPYLQQNKENIGPRGCEDTMDGVSIPRQTSRRSLFQELWKDSTPLMP